MFRLWQPHQDAYMLVWNALVARHTIEMLLPEAAAPVMFKAGLLWGQNGLDPEKPEHGPLVMYFLSLALAGEGIDPVLAQWPTKWFWLVDPIGANALLSLHVEEIVGKVVRDLWNKHGLQVQPPAV